MKQKNLMIPKHKTPLSLNEHRTRMVYYEHFPDSQLTPGQRYYLKHRVIKPVPTEEEQLKKVIARREYNRKAVADFRARKRQAMA